MTTELGKPLLIPGPAELWLLAHVTPHGVQPTLYNFRSIGEGIAFCARHDERPALEIDGRRLRFRDLRLLLAIEAGADSIGKAATAAHAGRAQAAASAVVLIDGGWLRVEEIAGAKRTKLRLTAAGLELAAQVRAA